MQPLRTLVLGAAGRDFHNFNVVYRDDPRYEVVGFTAAQIPDIAGRRYPPELAGPRYPDGIPIFDEGELAPLVGRLAIRQVVFSYSDVSYVYVMHRAAIANAAGADFVLLGPAATMLKSAKPVVAVCAVRTGAGKSQTTRRIARLLRERASASASSGTRCRTAISLRSGCSGSPRSPTWSGRTARSRRWRSTRRIS
jgi:predicted GTPase